MQVAGTANNQNPIFKITDTKLYVPVVTLSGWWWSRKSQAILSSNCENERL